MTSKNEVASASASEESSGSAKTDINGTLAVDEESTSARHLVPIEISSDTIHQAGSALFVLWLKIAATLFAARLLVLIWPVLVLLVISLMLVATLNPLVRRLQKWLTRASAISVVVFGIIATTGTLLVLMISPLVRQAHNLLINMPQYLTKIETAARGMGLKVRLHGSSLDLSQQASILGPETFNALVTVFSGITAILTVAVLTTYLLIDGSRVATSAVGLLPRHQRLHVRQMFGEIGAQVGDYMRGQLITSAQAGLFSYILLLLLGVPEPLALAFLMAVADVIPMVGILIGTVPAVLVALTISPRTAFIVLVGYVVYHLFESHILVPRIYGKTMKLSPSIIVVAVLVGAMLMGITGALLALPVAAAVPVVFRYVQEWREREDELQGSTDRTLP